MVKANFGTGNDLQIFHDGSDSIIRDAGTGSLKFQYGTSDGVVFDSSGNVGIGTVLPTFAAGGGLNVVNGTFATIRARGGSSTGIDFAQDSSSNGYLYNRDNASIIFGTNNTERMRIDSSGNLLVVKTAENVAVVGHELRSSGFLASTRNGATVSALTRLSSDGTILEFRKDSTAVGSIGVGNTNRPYIGQRRYWH